MMYLFDLDLTIWDCYNRYGNPIWAKQMVYPFCKEGRTITDDVYSVCTLRKGVKEYLQKLSDDGHKIGFVSAGSHLSLAYETQPSIKLLEEFGVYQYFNNVKILAYKTYDKCQVIKNISEPVVFFDDNSDVLNSISDFKHVTAVDTSTLSDWTELIGNNYDRYIVRSS